MRFAYSAMIQPIAAMPTAARMITTGVATPAPYRPAPTISGSTRAEEKTGPMKPTDWAMTSGSRSPACRSGAAPLTVLLA